MHIASDVQKKIKRIELFTKRLLSGSLVGSSRSAIKGLGFEFDQIREYQVGDDVRTIDWNASARMNTMLVKQYIEERSRTIIVVVDVSRSMLFGKDAEGKYERVAWIACILSLVATYGSDRVGCLLYADDVELYIPPGSGQTHVHRIMQTLFEYTPHKKTTTISVALKHLLGPQHKRSMVFLISDFIDDSLEQYLAQAAKRHDIIAIRCLDTYECVLPSFGLFSVADQEDGSAGMLDLYTQDTNALLAQRLAEQNALFKRCGITCVDNRKGDAFIGELVSLFRRRMQY